MSTVHPTNPTRGFGLAAVGTGFPAALGFILFMLNVVYVPSAKKTFDEFGLMLPLSTQGVIRFSNWVTAYRWALAPVVALSGLLNFVLLRSLVRRGQGAPGRWVVPGVWVSSMSLFLLAVIAFTIFWVEQGPLRLSNWICEHWWAMIPLLALVALGNFAVMRAPGRREWAVPGVWIACTSLFFLAAITLTVFSIALPMRKLQQFLAS